MPDSYPKVLVMLIQDHNDPTRHLPHFQTLTDPATLDLYAGDIATSEALEHLRNERRFTSFTRKG